MSWLSQTGVITAMFLRTIPQRLGWSAAAATGIALTVAVMVWVFSIAEGFKATLERTGSPSNALVMRTGADSEMSSSLDLDSTRIIADAPGVLRDADGPVASAELFVIVDLPKRSTGTEANVPLRGVGSAAFAVRGNIEIIEGERFTPGRNEIIVGVGAQREFEGLEVGNTLRWGQNDWKVVGVFTAEGALTESELWCDIRVLQPAYRRENMFQSVYARLESPDRFNEFKDVITSDPRLRVKVQREDEYYASQSVLLENLIKGLGGLVTALMAVGAVFGAINTMYSAVASRTREIATLRALGFGGGPVVVSVMAESLLLSLVGGTIGGLAAYLLVDGYRAATLNWQSFSQVVFAFRVTPQLLAQGLAVSLLLGLIGGFFPAIRAVRVPVATALREL